MINPKFMALAFMALTAGGLVYAVHDSRTPPPSRQAAIQTPQAAPAPVPVPSLQKPRSPRAKPPFHAPPMLAFRTTRRVPRHLTAAHKSKCSHCICPSQSEYP